MASHFPSCAAVAAALVALLAVHCSAQTITYQVSNVHKFCLLPCAVACLPLLTSSPACHPREQGAGCAVLPPTGPTNLAAAPGDGQLTLTWSRPANGACVDNYIATVASVGSQQRSFSGPQSTAQYSLLLTGLQNGIRYETTLTAVSSLFPDAQDASASVTATPQPTPTPPASLCSPFAAPGSPQNLRATPCDAALRVCFDAPQFGCADGYDVSATPVTVTR